MTKTWAVEALLLLRDDGGLFPAPFAALVEKVADLDGGGSLKRAEALVWEALRREEITAAFDADLNLLLSFGPHAASGKGRWAMWMRERIWKGDV